MQPKLEQQGFLTVVQNTDVDYLRLAYLQAMSIKLTMPGSKYAVLVDENTLAQVTDKHRKVFDYVILLNIDHANEEKWKLANEWQVHQLTPFKETIKVEADLIFTRSIEHWWTIFRLRDIVLSIGSKDYQGNASTSRRYRKVFDDNDLPDVYNGLMYFRHTAMAAEFFYHAYYWFAHWENTQALIKNPDDKPTTDLVYALVVKELGLENCTLPSCDFINFTHMKNSINNWPESKPWPELVVSEIDAPMIRINGLNQYHPFHYQHKEWVTDDIIEKFEQCMKAN
jgi:hypothetical protein